VFLSGSGQWGGCSVHVECILSLTWAGRLRDVDQLDRRVDDGFGNGMEGARVYCGSW
jgi:hypothetical protein